jgi:hypothetical protein
VIEYLMKNGHEQVLRDLRDNMMQIKTLTEFQYYDEEVRQDFGLNGKKGPEKKQNVFPFLLICFLSLFLIVSVNSEGTI